MNITEVVEGAGMANSSIVWTKLNIFKVIAVPIIAFVNIFGNSFVIYTVAFSTNLSPSISKCFVFNLATTDLLVGTVVLPFATISSIHGYWPFSDLLCTLCSIIEESACIASIVFLGLLSIDRYIAISRPLTYFSIMSKRVIGILMILGWILTFCTTILPGFLLWPLDTAKIILCSWGEYEPYKNMASFQTTIFFMSLTLVLICNWRVYAAAKIQQRLIERANSLFTVELVRQINYDCIPVFQQENKAAKTIARIVGGFLVCWVPFFSVYVLVAVPLQFKERDDILKTLIWFGYFNSCINPIIYVSTTESFALHFKQLLKKMY